MKPRSFVADAIADAIAGAVSRAVTLAALTLLGAIASTATAANATDTVASMPEAAIDGAAPADDPARLARWKALREAIFGNREINEGTAVIQMDAPPRALDAALVPLGLTLVGGKQIKGVYLVIDNNPSPLAGHITFGPAADPSSLKLRVRVNEYTLVHAIAETRDGELYGVEKFVKAAGGCSAPAGTDEAEALQEMGRMKLRLLGEFAPGKPMQAQLLIRHPNFNGMQMNQVTRIYTPARFIRTLEVSYGGAQVLRVESDISMSTDPAITFGFVPKGPGTLEVKAEDSEDARFAQSFPVPAPAAPSSAAAQPAPATSVPEPEDFWTGPVNGPVPATLSGGTVIRAADVAAMLKQRQAVIVDVSNSPARPEKLAPQAVWLPPPHPVIPGSMWVAGAGAGAVDPATERLYRQRLAEATENNLDRPVVVYCHERCWLSWNAAKRAIRYGYRNVYWFPDGIEGWRAAGFATATVPAQAPALSSSARS
jgi:sulfur-oxidizing protein SoxY